VAPIVPPPANRSRRSSRLFVSRLFRAYDGSGRRIRFHCLAPRVKIRRLMIILGITTAWAARLLSALPQNRKQSLFDASLEKTPGVAKDVKVRRERAFVFSPGPDSSRASRALGALPQDGCSKRIEPLQFENGRRRERGVRRGQ